MPDTFYANFTKSLQDNGFGDLLSEKGKLPACSYPACASGVGALQTFSHKQASGECPAQKISVCVSKIEVTNNGSMGNIDAAAKQSCGIGNTTTAPPPASASSTGLDINSIIKTLTQNTMYLGIGGAVVVFLIILSLLMRHTDAPHQRRRRNK